VLYASEQVTLQFNNLTTSKRQDHDTQTLQLAGPIATGPAGELHTTKCTKDTTKTARESAANKHEQYQSLQDEAFCPNQTSQFSTIFLTWMSEITCKR
jgi:hypothetical protein